jgi:hypothetical protein
VEVFIGSECSSAPVAVGSADEFASPGLSVSVPDDSVTSFSAHAVANGVSGPCSDPISYVEDSSAGSIVLATVSPPGPANDNLPRVSGMAETDASVLLLASPNCGGAPAATGTGADLAGPGIGLAVADDSTTSISGMAIDEAGNRSACAGPLKYTEDSTAPQTKIAKGPRKRSSDRTPSFRFHASEANATFTCKIDAKPFRRCPAFWILRRLALGRHRLAVAAVDAVGNVDPTPATRSWRVVRVRRHRAVRKRSRRH